MITKMYVHRLVESRWDRTLAEYSDVVDIPRKGDLLEFRDDGFCHQVVLRVFWRESPVKDGFHVVDVYTRDARDPEDYGD